MPEPTRQDDHEAERGATMLEYGFLITLIGVVVALALGPFSEAVTSLYDSAAAIL